MVRKKRRRERGTTALQTQADNARKSREALAAKYQREQAARFRPYHNFDEPVVRTPYQEYLLSDLWRNDIRPRILQRDNHTCRVCGERKNPEVHHVSYHPDVLAGKRDEYLVTLCSWCHNRVEFDGTDKRTDTQAKSNLLLRMMITKGNL